VRHADLILCASAFTRRSLLEAGADERRCRIVPYGIDLPPAPPPAPAGDAFRAVFVGSGGQRKGLHTPPARVEAREPARVEPPPPSSAA